MANAPITPQQGSTPAPSQQQQQQGQIPETSQQQGQPVFRDWASI